jgi:hypothetical protein
MFSTFDEPVLNPEVQKQKQKKKQVLRLTTPELKSVRGPFRSG